MMPNRGQDRINSGGLFQVHSSPPHFHLSVARPRPPSSASVRSRSPIHPVAIALSLSRTNRQPMRCRHCAVHQWSSCRSPLGWLGSLAAPLVLRLDVDLDQDARAKAIDATPLPCSIWTCSNGARLRRSDGHLAKPRNEPHGPGTL